MSAVSALSAYVVLPGCRALCKLILSSKRTLDALPEPVDPVSLTLTTIAALTLGVLILGACFAARGLLWLVDGA